MKKIKYSEITPEKIYNRRRSFIKSMGYGLGALTLNSVPLINAKASNSNKLNSYEDITTYNNYYEFGTGKGDPHRRAKNFSTRPWSIKIVKSSAFCSENNRIISDNYKITKDQKIGIIPPIGGG